MPKLTPNISLRLQLAAARAQDQLHYSFPSEAKMPHACLFYDVVSPYTHISLNVWARYIRKNVWPVTLQLRPMFLGGVMKATGNSPPGLVAAKGGYMQQDLFRASAHAGVPMLETPSNFLSDVARKVLQVQRVLAAVEEHGGMSHDTHLDLALAFSHAIHANKLLRDGSELHVDDSLFESAFRLAGVQEEDAKTLIELAASQAVKQRLAATTDEAVARGVFGSPTVFVSNLGEATPKLTRDGGEFMLFGSDRFEMLAYFLDLPWMGPNPEMRPNI